MAGDCLSGNNTKKRIYDEYFKSVGNDTNYYAGTYIKLVLAR